MSRGRQPGEGCMMLFVLLLWLGIGAGCIWAAVDNIGKPLGAPGSFACIAASWILGPIILVRLWRRK